MPKKAVKSKKKKKAAPPPAPPSKLYRRIAFTFLGAAVLLFLVVFYVSLARVSIVITPKREVLTATFNVLISPTAGPNTIAGTVAAKSISTERAFPLKGDAGAVTEAQAWGKVTIINTTGRDQPLVRTTRLLTPDQRLFRIDKTVLVPAQGSVEVGIHADQLGTQGEIGPSRFTIPGLWEGLQDKIYAESTTPTCCGTKTVRVVTETDLTETRQTLTNEIMASAKETLRAESGADFSGEVFIFETTQESLDAELGEEKDAITGTMAMDITAVFYDKEAVTEQATNILKGLAGEERELVALDPARVEVEVQKTVDSGHGTAVLAVEAPGILILRPGTDLFEIARITGLSPEAVQAYFAQFRSIESVEIRFAVPWQKTLPNQRDRIKIEIAE